MSKNLEQIVDKLPEGLSESGIQEIKAVIDETVESRVNEHVNVLTAKVSGYLRLKLDEMKETARRELEASDETFRAVKIYEALKSVVADDVASSDEASLIARLKDDNAELRESMESLNKKLSVSINENNTLEDAVSTLKENVTSLEESEKAPFKSSEQALVITNENEDRRPQGTNNAFLTEDVLKLV
jgi:hypothetical protein